MKVPTAGILLMVLAVHLDLGFGQDANCDFSQIVAAGVTYYVYSPRYPSNYTAGITCRWQATCPVGFNIRVNCLEIRLPQSPSCLMDRLLISRSGDPYLAGAEVYCGTGSTTIVSDQQAISLALLTPNTSPGGRFMCTLVAVPAPPTNTCNCGWKKTNRIVGGAPTDINEYPMMAGIVDLRIYEIKCGATIVSTRYLVTAAHCLDGHTVATVAVVVGEHDTTIGDSPATQAHAIMSFVKHSLYNSNTYDYDVAVMRTVTEIVFSDRVGPACLPFNSASNTFANTIGTLLGWGTQFFGGPKSNVLREVNVNVISNANCQAYSSSVTPRQICTLTPGKDSCQDDSGGPLLYQNPSSGRLVLIGITSAGSSCAARDSPARNTRLTSCMDWIVNNTPDVLYCKLE